MLNTIQTCVLGTSPIFGEAEARHTRACLVNTGSVVGTASRCRKGELEVFDVCVPERLEATNGAVVERHAVWHYWGSQLHPDGDVASTADLRLTQVEAGASSVPEYAELVVARLVGPGRAARARGRVDVADADAVRAQGRSYATSPTGRVRLVR